MALNVYGSYFDAFKSSIKNALVELRPGLSA